MYKVFPLMEFIPRKTNENGVINGLSAIFLPIYRMAQIQHYSL
jgi:hypothetical protein